MDDSLKYLRVKNMLQEVHVKILRNVQMQVLMSFLTTEVCVKFSCPVELDFLNHTYFKKLGVKEGPERGLEYTEGRMFSFSQKAKSKPKNLQVSEPTCYSPNISKRQRLHMSVAGDRLQTAECRCWR